jgi:hypothetical protein
MTDNDPVSAGDGFGPEMLRDLRQQYADLALSIDSLKVDYRRAGGEVRRKAEEDIRIIADLRQEAETLVDLIQGGSLFGRYFADAEAHKKSANRWRGAAIGTLLVAVGLEVFLALVWPKPIGVAALVAPVLPLVLLFTYLSVESRNHRRAEFSRRRIFLRMNAIETYTKGNDDEVGRDDLRRILHTFIERHFIEPELDPSHVDSVVALGAWPFRARVVPQRG